MFLDEGKGSGERRASNENRWACAWASFNVSMFIVHFVLDVFSFSFFTRISLEKVRIIVILFW